MDVHSCKRTWHFEALLGLGGVLAAFGAIRASHVLGGPTPRFPYAVLGLTTLGLTGLGMPALPGPGSVPGDRDTGMDRRLVRAEEAGIAGVRLGRPRGAGLRAEAAVTLIAVTVIAETVLLSVLSPGAR